MRTKSEARRGIRMKSELEVAIYDGVIEAWKSARMVSGSPLEWYATQRVFIGYKTFLRRLGTGDWTLDEIERIQRDLKSPRIQEILNRRLAA